MSFVNVAIKVKKTKEKNRGWMNLYNKWKTNCKNLFYYKNKQ